jgi:Na+:H+ antiporter, NhaA family
VNDGLMAIFFLLIGLELERELYVGELSSFKNALLPIFAAAGGILLPADLGWRHIIGAGMLGGIGFTMSIFITNLAFAGQLEHINASKMAILCASLLAGVLGLVWLRWCGRSQST